jgi:hypothetical protein
MKKIETEIEQKYLNSYIVESSSELVENSTATTCNSIKSKKRFSFTNKRKISVIKESINWSKSK